MDMTYFKRYRMEINLRDRCFGPVLLPPGYRLLPWRSDHLLDHAEAKFMSFRDEVDADVFSCLGEMDGCHALMEEISLKEGFLPEATFLAEYTGNASQRIASLETIQPCGTIQGLHSSNRCGGIQNVGITPQHRGLGLGTALITASLLGFQQKGVTRVCLEVTARNDRAIELYKRLGFRQTKTLYKAVELARL